MLGLPNVTDKLDGANGSFSKGAWVAAAILVPVVVLLQQVLLRASDPRVERAPASLVQNEAAEFGGLEDLAIGSKYLLKSLNTVELLHGAGGRTVDDSDLDEEGRTYREEMTRDLERLAVSRTDRVRFAIVMGEVMGKDEAMRRLEAVRKEATPEGELARDIEFLKDGYAKGSGSLSREVREWLIDRHGWFARVAFAYGKPDTSNERQRLVGGIDGPIMVGVASNIVGFVTLGIGFFCAIRFVQGLRAGEFTDNFDAPAIGGTVYLESFVLFLVGFALLDIVSIFMAVSEGALARALLVTNEVMLWGLGLCVLWPLARGVPWSYFKLDLGLHTGEGWWEELKWGLFGFLAAYPLSWGVAWFVRLFEGLAREETTGVFEGYPLFESPAGATWWIAVLDSLSAVVWAPMVEELLMRGALYRTLRGKLGPWACAAITAVIFGVIHPYSPAGLASVAVGGFVYAILREARGSLIAPIFAHFLHNGTITAFSMAGLLALE